MTDPGHSEEENAGEGVRVSDKRRIDPETYEVREGVAPTSLTDDALAAEEAAASAIEGDVVGIEAKVAELTADLQRVHAEYANYRKRIERDREVMQQMAVASALIELLPLLDDIGRARGQITLPFRSVKHADGIGACPPPIFAIPNDIIVQQPPIAKIGKSRIFSGHRQSAPRNDQQPKQDAFGTKSHY